MVLFNILVPTVLYFCDIKTPRRDALKERQKKFSQETEIQSIYLLILFLEVKMYMNFLGVASAQKEA